MIRRPVRTVAWTLSLIVAGIAAGGVVALVATVSVNPIEDRAAMLAEKTLPAEAALQATASAATRGQTAFLEAAAAADPVAKAAAINQAQKYQQAQVTAWGLYRDLGGRSEGERRLQRRYEDANQQSRTAAATVIGLTADDPALAATLSAEQAAAAALQNALDELDRQYYQPVARESADAALTGVTDARRNVIVAFAAALVLFLGVGIAVLRRAARFERAEGVRSRRHALEARQADLETRIQRGLELEGSEEATYPVVRQAMQVVAPGSAVEFLVADSSRAHFRQVVSTSDEESTRCQVGAPGECPAASSGQTREFNDSRNLDTCPYLRDSAEPAWAICVPVSIAGRTTGVLHAGGSVEAPAAESLATELELVARKVGERIGVLRVLARTEAQAQADPLTGLPNRRTLEHRTHDLLDSDMPFVVAFADLDHFKLLNDIHGHDAGDRALRLFARVLRDSVRPRDIPARYGGEEFVVVLPDCTIVDARLIAERLRTRLAEALDGGTVPGFTVSVGLAAAEPGEAISEVIDRADAALMKAKQLGRDRVLAAGEILDTSSTPPELAPSLDPPTAVEPPPNR